MYCPLVFKLPVSIRKELHLLCLEACLYNKQLFDAHRTLYNAYCFRCWKHGQEQIKQAQTQAWILLLLSIIIFLSYTVILLGERCALTRIIKKRNLMLQY